ncbi:outer membrane protein [Methylocapsa sp. S129]|uniref:outer membrane protein n=1 Tax=Methylocapsa sp. S129 TaxID=1641869 RepID=UPI00131C8AEF|nr:outer membrane beta-barrel protein [Methylocapsa sp. S129]
MKKRGFAVALALLWIGPALAADLPTRKGMPDPPPPAPYNWTGFYIGVNAGYGWDGQNGRLSGDPSLARFFSANIFPTSLSLNSGGGLVGGQIGYNWQVEPSWVLGLETDLQWAQINGSESLTPVPTRVVFDPFATSISKTLDWFGTARLRAGFLPMPNVLVYGTGGLAYGAVKVSFRTQDTLFANLAACPGDSCAVGGNSATKVGGTLGGGVEVALNANWSIKGEYLYANLGKLNATAAQVAGGVSCNANPTASGCGFKASSRFQENIAHAGVNYKF